MDVGPDFTEVDFSRCSFSLEGRIALVTGASRGLGEAIALGMAHAGADVTVAARSVDDLERVAAKIEALGRHALVAPTDVTDPAQCRRMVEATVERFGRLEILVANAGLPRGAGPTLELAPERWDELILANLHSVFYSCQAAGRHMLERGYGKIITMSSQLGIVGYRHRAAYCAAKAGVNNLTRALAIEWAANGICVNALAPTHIETPANRERVREPSYVEEMLPKVPAARFGRWEDVVGAAVFLASPAADLITGQVLAIDGGWTAQ
jgi:NAD(P)-dependent dehydrogenase (short-subunit alcohol dehydrogenase family)